MSDPVEDDVADDSAALDPARQPATIDDFAAVDVEAPVRALKTCEANTLRDAYGQAFRQAEIAGDATAMRVYRVLEGVCGIAMRAADRGNVWGPSFTAGTWRSAVPGDFLGDQTTVLAAVAPGLVNPGLRARVADIAWTNDRKAGATAGVAVEAYCDCAEGLVAGTLQPWIGTGEHAIFEAIDPIHRAMQIVHRTTKKGQRPNRPLEVFAQVYEAARDQRAYYAFSQLAEIALHFELKTQAELAADAADLAQGAEGEKYAMVVKGVWDLAAQLYANLKDDEAARRCRIGAFEQTLLMREQVRGSAAAEAGWVTQALMQLRHIEGMEEREQALELELRQLQKASLKQMAPIPIDLEVEGEAQQIAEHFEGLSLADALRQFALLERSPDLDALRQQALDSLKAAPMGSMFSAVYLDDEGRSVAKAAGAPHSGEPDESWFRRMAGQYESLRRARVVAGYLHPARATIQLRFDPQERHFEPIVEFSGFVPAPQKPLVVLGFTRLFQGDLMSAAHLLIPQLEPCLREILKRNGHDPSKRRDDETEEDLALSRLLPRFRSELEKIFSPAITDEIDRLFNARPGPALRHELAHGQLSAGACYHADVYYACWFLYRLCCLFILKDWDQIVGAQFTAQGD
jgi:hypothetical protein